MSKAPSGQRLGFFAILLSGLVSAVAQAAPPPLDAFLKSYGVDDVALSPDGAWLAAVQHAAKDEDLRVLAVYRIQGTELSLHKGSKLKNVRVYDLAWANDERLLVTLQAYDPETRSALTVSGGGRRITWRPPQVLSLDPDLQNSVLLLKDESDFKYTVNKSEILHGLPSDPKHVLMEIYDSRGRQGLNVYKVNVYDGKAELVERGRSYTDGWMVDANAQVRLRIDDRTLTTRYLARNPGEEDWFEIARFRRRETPEILPLAFSPDPDILYVLARQGGDRLAVFEYRMSQRKLGRLVFAHPKVDVTGALVTRPGNRLVGFRYVIHKPRAHYLDETLKRFDAKLERTFGRENFTRPLSVSRDGHVMVLEVTGPRNPGTYYLYDAAANRANLIGAQSVQLLPQQMGKMKPIVYKARDGLEINAYYTAPPGNPQRAPLVVMPHGGPEVRDYLQWDAMVQFLATRGYAVLQPNFRGSDGFGKKFAEAGYGQWGRKMQDDITDGVRHVTAAGLADPQRICIVGASYGGYAALAGAAFTPDLYKCAVSINGVSDLYEMMKTERDRESAFRYWKKSVGDPGEKTDREQMKNLSPARNVEKIKIPILLIAGEKDNNVKVDQSRDMAGVLSKAGKPYEYIEFEGEGHAIREYENRKRMFEALWSFLDRHIGSGMQPSAEPAASPAAAR